MLGRAIGREYRSSLPYVKTHFCRKNSSIVGRSVRRKAGKVGGWMQETRKPQKEEKRSLEKKDTENMEMKKPEEQAKTEEKENYFRCASAERNK